MFVLKMFYKRLIATGFHTHHFKMFLKCFLSYVLKTSIKNFLYLNFQNAYQTCPNKDDGEQ